MDLILSKNTHFHLQHVNKLQNKKILIQRMYVLVSHKLAFEFIWDTDDDKFFWVLGDFSILS